MKRTRPGRFWLLISVGLLTATAAWAAKVSPITKTGDGTYSITVSATDKFTRNTEKLKAIGQEEAARFCAKEGKQFKLVSATEKKSMYLVGDFATTTLTFQALDAGDPELAAAPEARARLTPPPTATDSLYEELTKLDDLRKKGILTDEEFTAQKKKVLERSK